MKGKMIGIKCIDGEGNAVDINEHNRDSFTQIGITTIMLAKFFTARIIGKETDYANKFTNEFDVNKTFELNISEFIYNEILSANMEGACFVADLLFDAKLKENLITNFGDKVND